MIVSTDPFNWSAADLVAVVPITRTRRGIPFHFEVHPPEGGLTTVSYVLCDQIRTIAKSRLGTRRGAFSPATMQEIESRVRILMDL